MRASKSKTILRLPFPSPSGRAAALSSSSSLLSGPRLSLPSSLSALTSSSTHQLLPLSSVCRFYGTRSENFERNESRFDFSKITNRVWPRRESAPLDYRNYVPVEEEDELDEWKPEEDYPELSFSSDRTTDQLLQFITTPRPVPVKRDAKGAYLGTGRRKAAIARVSLTPGDGTITINGRTFLDYFPCFFERGAVLAPFVAIERPNMFNVNVKVSGGGTKGQAEAIQLGIARALQGYELAFRPALKKAGCLKRDPRVVESKKAGRVKARKRPQWSKR